MVVDTEGIPAFGEIVSAPSLRPPLCLADSVALLATTSLILVVSTPVGVELGAVSPPSDLEAFEQVAGSWEAAESADPVQGASWVRLVPHTLPLAGQRSAGADSKRVEVRSPKSPAPARPVAAATTPMGRTVVASARGLHRLTLHREDGSSLLRYRASAAALRRLAHRPVVQLSDGPIPTAQQPILRLPLNAGLQSWQAARDLVLAGHLPHPELIRTESFVAAVGLPVVPGDRASPRVHHWLARDPADPYTIWMQVVAVAPNQPMHTDLPLDLVVLIDTSGSMGISGGLDEARTAVQDLAANLKDEDRITVLGFEGSATELVSGRGAAVQTELSHALSTLEGAGATDAAGGVLAALSVIDRRKARRGKTIPQVVLFSDGDLFATGADVWQEAVEKVVAAGIGLTSVGVGQAWAESGALEARLAWQGVTHLAARDGHEATNLLESHLFADRAGEALPTRLSLLFDPRTVASYEVVGWSGEGPGRVAGAEIPTVWLAPGEQGSAVLRLQLHPGGGAHRSAGRARLDVGTDPDPVVVPLMLGEDALPELSAVPELAMAAAAGQLAEALRDGSADRLGAAAEAVALSVRDDQPVDAVLLRVARRAANLAALPHISLDDEPGLQPALAHLMDDLTDACFLDLQARRGEVHGQIIARARFLRGQLAAAVILDNPLEDRMLEGCVIQQLRTWKPPSRMEGDLVLPLVWGPGPDGGGEAGGDKG